MKTSTEQNQIRQDAPSSSLGINRQSLPSDRSFDNGKPVNDERDHPDEDDVSTIQKLLFFTVLIAMLVCAAHLGGHI
jgi:hypothetical protein